MKYFEDTQPIAQLDKNRGAYFYITLDAQVVNQFEKKRLTRFLGTLENSLTFRCGLNHLGDGNFFIILGKQRLKQIGKGLGDTITFHLKEDPNPLGVEMPQVLTILLAQDEVLKAVFEQLSMGKKRHVIHTISKIKDIDKQVGKATKLLNLYAKK